MFKLLLLLGGLQFSNTILAQTYLVPFFEDSYMGLKNEKDKVIVEPEFEKISYKGGKIMELTYTHRSYERKKEQKVREIPNFQNIQHLHNGEFLNCEENLSCSLNAQVIGYSIFSHKHGNLSYHQILDSKGEIIYTFKDAYSANFIYSDKEYAILIVNTSSYSRPKYMMYSVDRKNNQIKVLTEDTFYKYNLYEIIDHPDISFIVELNKAYVFNKKLNILSNFMEYRGVFDSYENRPNQKLKLNILRTKERRLVFKDNLVNLLDKNDSVNLYLPRLVIEADKFTFSNINIYDDAGDFPAFIVVFRNNKKGLYSRDYEEIIPIKYDEIVNNQYNTSADGAKIFANFYITRKGSKYGIFTLKTDEEFLKYEIDYLLEPVFDHIPLFYYDDYYNIKDLKIFGLYDRETSKLVGFANDKGKMY